MFLYGYSFSSLALLLAWPPLPHGSSASQFSGALSALLRNPLSWIMDDTWKTRRDAARRLAPVGTYAVSPPRIGEPGWMEWAIDKKWNEDSAIRKARQMPTSRRALMGH